MKSIKSISIAIAIGFLTISACKKRIEETKEIKKPKIFSEYLGERKLNDFIGTVVDTNNSPLDSVTISIGNKTTMTNRFGQFTIKDADVNSDSAYIEVKKKAYQNKVISVVHNNTIHKLSVVLHKETKSCLFWFCPHNHSLPNSD